MNDPTDQATKPDRTTRMILPVPSVVAVGDGRAAYLRAHRPGVRTALLLHGGGLDRASLSWRALLPRLAETHDVLAPNWPGYGGSTPFDRPYRIADLGAWLIAFLDALHIARADVVGVSMGGGAALWLALHHPHRVRRLVPVCPYGLQRRAPLHPLSYVAAQLPLTTLTYAVMRGSRWATRRALGSIFAVPARIDTALVEEVRDTLSDRMGARAFVHFQRGEIGPRRLHTVLSAEVGGIAHPTLFVHGRADTLVPLADVRSAADRMPNADLAVLDAGHWPMREVPDVFNDLVERFLVRDAVSD